MNDRYSFGTWDTQTDKVSLIKNKTKTKTHRPFGITWTKTELLLAQPTEIEIYNQKFEYQKTIQKGMWYGNHQILQNKSDLFVVSPRINGLVKINKKSEYLILGKKITSKLPSSFVDKNSLEYSEDQNHLNSIFIDKNIYVMAHNKENPSEIYVLDDSNQIIKTYPNLGINCHNIGIVNGEIYYIDSLGLKGIKSLKGKTIPLGNDNHFVRGLVITKDYFVSSRSIYTKSQKDRKEGDSELILVNRKNDKIEKCIKVKDIGNICDIRCLTEWDFSHGKNGFLKMIH